MAFLSVVKLVSWFTPAPELTQLLLDWSRSRKRESTGGITIPSLSAASRLFLSSFSWRNFFLPSKEGIRRARQVLFAQQLVAGVSDSGSFGGSAMSDVNTRILERNRVATEVLHAVLMDEIKSKNISDNFR